MLKELATRAAFPIVLISILAVRALAQSRSEMLGDAQKQVVDQVGKIRKALLEGMSPEEREFEKKIEYRVPMDDYYLGARSYMEGSRRVIDIDFGFERSLEMIVDAMVIQQRLGKPDFFQDYALYTARAIESNEQRRRNGLVPEFIESPYGRLGWGPAEIKRYEERADLREFWGKNLTCAMAVVLGHEMAHHYLGHLDHPVPSDSPFRRAQETAADKWAMKVAAAAHIPPIGGFVPLLYYYTIEKNGIKTARNRDHPPSLRRLRDTFQFTLDALPDFRKELEVNGQSYEETRRNLRLAIRQMDEELENGDASVNEPVHGSDGDTCSGLNAYVAGGRTRFSGLRGRLDPASDGEGFQGRRSVVGFSECTVWIYRDRSLSPSASCDALSNNFDEVADTVKKCLGSGWSSRVRDRSDLKELVLSNQTGISVRVHQKKGSIVLWVDSPDRN